MNQHRPQIDSATRTFWAAAADGRLLGSRCRTCGELAPHPRGFCPTCWSDDVEDVELSGRATLYTYSVVRVNPMAPFADLVPYVAAMVELEEGIRLPTRLIDVDPDDPVQLTIGMPLTAHFELIAPCEGLVLFGPSP